MSTEQTITITQGDTLLPVGAQLCRRTSNGREAVDLTGATVLFKMIDAEGAASIALTSTGVTVVDDESGTVQFAFSAGQTDTVGTYSLFFVRRVGGKDEHFPNDGNRFLLEIVAKLPAS